MGNKEILRKQELSSLKKEKEFKDEAAYINPENKPVKDKESKEKGKNSGLSIPRVLIPKTRNNGYSPATAFQPQAANDLGFTSKKPSNDLESLGIKIDKMTAANENNYPSSATPKTDDHQNRANVDRHGVSDESERVSTDRADTVGLTVSARSNEGENILGESSFNDLYQHVKTQVEEGKLKLSIRNMRKSAHRYIKDHATMKTASISMPETHYLVDKIRDKMINENFIIDNPDYTNGKAKYLLKTQDKT